MFEKAPRIDTYCIECEGEKSMAVITSLTSRFPDLRFCPGCSRAYDSLTGDPLGTNPVYFDVNFVQYGDDGQKMPCRLVGSRGELTPRVQ